MDATVTDNPGTQRWEARLDGDVVGYLTYRPQPGGLALEHTLVEPAREGRGLAGQLVRHALDDARGKGVAVLPYCSYVQGWIRQHPDQADLVPGDRREEFGL